MTREEAKHAATVLQAFADGKTIQYKPEGWEKYTTLRKDEEISSRLFYENPERYRIKPEPREWHIHFLHDGNTEVTVPNTGKSNHLVFDCKEKVRVREVLD